MFLTLWTLSSSPLCTLNSQSKSSSGIKCISRIYRFIDHSNLLRLLSRLSAGDELKCETYKITVFNHTSIKPIYLRFLFTCNLLEDHTELVSSVHIHAISLMSYFSFYQYGYIWILVYASKLRDLIIYCVQHVLVWHCLSISGHKSTPSQTPQCSQHQGHQRQGWPDRNECLEESSTAVDDQSHLKPENDKMDLAMHMYAINNCCVLRKSVPAST